MTVDFPDCPYCEGGRRLESVHQSNKAEWVVCDGCDGLGVLIPDEMVAIVEHAIEVTYEGRDPIGYHPSYLANPTAVTVAALKALVRWQRSRE